MLAESEFGKWSSRQASNSHSSKVEAKIGKQSADISKQYILMSKL